MPTIQCPRSVLLESHLAQSDLHPGLYPPELTSGVRSQLLYPGSPPPHPHCTWHTLRERQFDEGFGTYYGELDPKCRRNGYGHMVYAGDEGNVYQGTWKKGAIDGVGCFLWAATGSVYQGEWRRGERNGRGHFVFGPRQQQRSALPLAVCTGTWTNGRVRKGTEMVRFVNAAGQVEVASVEEADYSSGSDDNSSASASTSPSVAGRANKSFRKFIRSVVRR